MDDFIIYRNTAYGRKRHSPRDPLKEWHYILLLKELLHCLINFTSRDSWTNKTFGNLMGFPNNKAGLSHGLYLSTRF
jgi:hypothetical protein